MEPGTYRWLVDGAQLLTRSRQGGKIAIKGFEFQAIHAVDALIQLLTLNNGLVQVRYEGAQDLDLMYGDASQEFIQYKESEFAEYDFATLKEILWGFMRDTIDACGTPPDVTLLPRLQLRFMLVATGVYIGDDVASMIRGTNKAAHAEKLVDGFVYPAGNTLDRDSLLEAAMHVLSNLTLKVSPKQTNNEDLRVLAIGRLALFGVPPSQAEAALTRVKDLLSLPRHYFAGDVIACLPGLPDTHPANGRSPIGMLPSENTFALLGAVEPLFRESGRASWAAIHYALDAPRDLAPLIRDRIEAMADSGGVVLACGPICSGKSTLIRRIAWELHRSGRALVCEINDPDGVDNDAWEAASRIAQLARKPLVLVVDDLSRQSKVLAQIQRRPYDKTIILGSDRVAGAVTARTKIPTHDFDLAAISATELASLGKHLGRHIGQQQRSELSTLLTGGQMFSVSLFLRGTSLRRHAQAILTGLAGDPDHYRYYVAVCLCGMDDQSVPQPILRRGYPGVVSWKSKMLEGLVFADTLRERRIGSGHAALAQAVVEAAQCDVRELRETLIEATDFSQSEERRFALRLLQNTLARGGAMAQDLVYERDRLVRIAQEIGAHGDYLDILRFEKTLLDIARLGLPQLVNVAAELSACNGPDKVRSGQDAIAFLNTQADFKVRAAAALKVFDRLDISFGRNAFLNFMGAHGKAEPELQRLALESNLRWLAAHGYPAPESKTVVDYINYAVPASAPGYTDQLRDITESAALNEKSPSNTELIIAVCVLVKDGLRDQRLFALLLAVVQKAVSPLELVSHRAFCINLVHASRLAGSDKDRLNTFRLLVDVATSLPDNQIRSWFFMLAGLKNPYMDTLIAEFGARAQTLTDGDARRFVQDFHARIQEVFAAKQATVE